MTAVIRMSRVRQVRLGAALEARSRAVIGAVRPCAVPPGANDAALRIGERRKSSLGLLPSPVRAGSGSAGLWSCHTLSASALPGGGLQLPTMVAQASGRPRNPAIADVSRPL